VGDEKVEEKNYRNQKEKAKKESDQKGSFETIVTLCFRSLGVSLTEEERGRTALEAIHTQIGNTSVSRETEEWPRDVSSQIIVLQVQLPQLFCSR
jgi:hypothetical protein